jgi:hypothetical protein
MTQLTQWQRDVAAKFAAAVPMEEVTRIVAKGNHLAAQNDEAEPRVTHSILARESSGCGMSDYKRARCSCGWVGDKRFEYSDNLHSDLRSDEAQHLYASSLKARGASS